MVEEIKEKKICIEAVAFDMDGVIFDSERMYYEACLQAIDELKVPVDESHIRRFTGMSSQECLRLLYRDFGDVFDVSFFVNHWLAARDRWLYENGLPLIKGVDVLLHRLAAMQMPLALVTSAEKSSVQDNFRWAKLDALSLFSVVVTIEDVFLPKPNPEAYLRAADRLGVLPENMLVIEDSSHGARASVEAGAQTLFMPPRYYPVEQNVQGILQRIDDVMDVLHWI